ncbi:2,3-diaminopropionate biosynthesis protein SbnB [Lentzea pudingi]|uniref:2,3-diaminopropionate biosynthesis protein SbnB n=1 Tax=Lentzea pudingi TaxID=1789439 RepID=A0ABQ2HRD1_9PSEU|nr:2,3-diaminopropionate biosynthesis protein SbnB [Lentzea pudingi]GGM89397.1 2,3-diaminopropionate biosynthesis protein SbnB [Lentzea pudingi]
MNALTGAASFAVISGAAARSVLEADRTRVIELVDTAYRLHGDGHAINPPSYFLRFPDMPNARIIALPAALRGDEPAAGLKWISSFPDNLGKGLPRASAVLVLNDGETGVPTACLESSVISASRTAASAALAAVKLAGSRAERGRVGYVGTGPIARHIHSYLLAAGWPVDEIHVHDLNAARAADFGEWAAASGGPAVTVHERSEDLIPSCDVVVFATTAAKPHVTDPGLFAHHPLVLHVSLRDLSPEVLLDAVNVVDDVDHCLRAETSPHLTEQRTGSRDFVNATLHDVLTGAFTAPSDRTVVFSPFGLGVLDLVLARFVHAESLAKGSAVLIENFHEGIE